MADLAELDHRVGQLIDEVDALGIRDNTVFVMSSDNGPEFRDPWRGTAVLRGTYHTAWKVAYVRPSSSAGQVHIGRRGE